MANTGTTAPSHSNRLSREKSPYLLQHAHNPVDWFPWGDEAFEKARRENKPIFLSIGYSTCHWCHVMERESFEDEKVGAFLNLHFVSIKVDREERPDIDRIYMTFVQATTGSGGWPMSVFLTPQLKPFFGGTYFPPDNRHGRPGFLALLQHIHQLWNTRRDDLMDSAADVHGRLGEFMKVGAAPAEPLNADIVREAGLNLKQHFDPRHGGFGGAPKFPQPSLPSFLLRYARRFNDLDALRMVQHTCERMAAGGINDQLGGGFSRYAVDAEWLVPHFEKMLYDNAQLALLYLDVFRASGDARHAQVARDILHYVLRDMTHSEGGFYSAEDADSEGHEGKFYCWTRRELATLLSPEEFNVVVRHFGITEQGNFVDHSHPTPLQNQNVLSIVSPTSDSDAPLLASARNKMTAERSKRVRPHLDDKVLASWNGLMLAAFARAYAVLGDSQFRVAAERNVSFIRGALWDTASKTLYHRWREGERDSVQLLEAYAFLLFGVVELYEAILEPAVLEFAIDLADALLARFYDEKEGGFWQTAAGSRDVILRVKEAHDGAEPSGNSMAVVALLRLGAISGRREFTEAGHKTLALFAARLRQMPQSLCMMLHAVDFTLQDPARVVIAGQSDAATEALSRAVHKFYLPNGVVLGNRGPVEEFARGLKPREQSVAEAFLCSGNTCQAPTSDPTELERMLKSL